MNTSLFYIFDEFYVFLQYSIQQNTKNNSLKDKMYKVDDYGFGTFYPKPVNKRNKQNIDIGKKCDKREDLRKSLDSNLSRNSQRKGITLSKHLSQIERKQQIAKKEASTIVIMPFRRIQNQQIYSNNNSNSKVFQLRRPEPAPIFIIRHQTVLKPRLADQLSNRRSLTPCVRVQAINASPQFTNQASLYKKVSMRSFTTRESTQQRIQDIPNHIQTRKPSIINQYFRGSIIDDLKSFALIPSKKVV